MSDFRIKVSLTKKGFMDFEEELDWDGTHQRWSLSNREHDGVRWIEGQTPSPIQLGALLQFFRIFPGQVPLNSLNHLSPGELADIHRTKTSVVSIYSALCPNCGKHWYIFRWEPAEKQWRVYGRTCEFSWRRGEKLNEEELKMLKLARSLGSDPLRPPI